MSAAAVGRGGIGTVIVTVVDRGAPPLFCTNFYMIRYGDAWQKNSPIILDFFRGGENLFGSVHGHTLSHPYRGLRAT